MLAHLLSGQAVLQTTIKKYHLGIGKITATELPNAASLQWGQYLAAVVLSLIS